MHIRKLLLSHLAGNSILVLKVHQFSLECRITLSFKYDLKLNSQATSNGLHKKANGESNVLGSDMAFMEIDMDHLRNSSAQCKI